MGPYVVIVFDVGDVYVPLLCPDSKHPSCVRDRVLFVRSYVAIVVAINMLSQ